MDYLAHLRCSICGDSWFQEMLDIEVSAFMAENPKPPLTVIGTTTYLDFEETLCDGCEDYSDYQSEADEQNNTWSEAYGYEDEDLGDLTDELYLSEFYPELYGEQD